MDDVISKETKIEICREDFYFMLKNAMLLSGGSMDMERIKDMSLHEIAQILAPNGIRMLYMPEKHVSNLYVSWGDDTFKPKVMFDVPSEIPSNEAKSPPPQLLED